MSHNLAVNADGSYELYDAKHGDYHTPGAYNPCEMSGDSQAVQPTFNNPSHHTQSMANPKQTLEIERLKLELLRAQQEANYHRTKSMTERKGQNYEDHIYNNDEDNKSADTDEIKNSQIRHLQRQVTILQADLFKKDQRLQELTKEKNKAVDNWKVVYTNAESIRGEALVMKDQLTAQVQDMEQTVRRQHEDILRLNKQILADREHRLISNNKGNNSSNQPPNRSSSMISQSSAASVSSQWPAATASSNVGVSTTIGIPSASMADPISSSESTDGGSYSQELEHLHKMVDTLRSTVMEQRDLFLKMGRQGKLINSLSQTHSCPPKQSPPLATALLEKERYHQSSSLGKISPSSPHHHHHNAAKFTEQLQHRQAEESSETLKTSSTLPISSVVNNVNHRHEQQSQSSSMNHRPSPKSKSTFLMESQTDIDLSNMSDSTSSSNRKNHLNNRNVVSPIYDDPSVAEELEKCSDNNATFNVAHRQKSLSTSPSSVNLTSELATLSVNSGGGVILAQQQPLPRQTVYQQPSEDCGINTNNDVVGRSSSSSSEGGVIVGVQSNVSALRTLVSEDRSNGSGGSNSSAAKNVVGQSHNNVNHPFRNSRETTITAPPPGSEEFKTSFEPKSPNHHLSHRDTTSPRSPMKYSSNSKPQQQLQQQQRINTLNLIDDDVSSSSAVYINTSDSATTLTLPTLTEGGGGGMPVWGVETTALNYNAADGCYDYDINNKLLPPTSSSGGVGFNSKQPTMSSTTVSPPLRYGVPQAPLTPKPRMMMMMSPSVVNSGDGRSVVRSEVIHRKANQQLIDTASLPKKSQTEIIGHNNPNNQNNVRMHNRNANTAYSQSSQSQPVQRHQVQDNSNSTDNMSNNTLIRPQFPPDISHSSAAPPLHGIRIPLLQDIGGQQKNNATSRGSSSSSSSGQTELVWRQQQMINQQPSQQSIPSDRHDDQLLPNSNNQQQQHQFLGRNNSHLNPSHLSTNTTITTTNNSGLKNTTPSSYCTAGVGGVSSNTTNTSGNSSSHVYTCTTNNPLTTNNAIPVSSSHSNTLSNISDVTSFYSPILHRPTTATVANAAINNNNKNNTPPMTQVSQDIGGGGGGINITNAIIDRPAHTFAGTGTDDNTNVLAGHHYDYNNLLALSRLSQMQRQGVNSNSYINRNFNFNSNSNSNSNSDSNPPIGGINISSSDSSNSHDNLSSGGDNNRGTQSGSNGSSSSSSLQCPMCHQWFTGISMDDFQTHVYDCFDNESGPETLTLQAANTNNDNINNINSDYGNRESHDGGGQQQQQQYLHQIANNNSNTQLQQYAAGQAHTFGRPDIVGVGLLDYKLCPMCQQKFPKTVPQEEFEQHVHRHFGEEPFELIGQ